MGHHRDRHRNRKWLGVISVRSLQTFDLQAAFSTLRQPPPSPIPLAHLGGEPARMCRQAAGISEPRPSECRDVLGVLCTETWLQTDFQVLTVSRAKPNPPPRQGRGFVLFRS